jgi:thiol-disulfide isomerase/thioredoxin
LGSAPEFTGITGWLNTEAGKSLSLEALRGKVVLVDFWTYSCINCIRTLPYVQSWYTKYQDDGFVVIGVHTPEFLFEHKKENVQEAIARYGITYPVAQDNDYATWQAYQNQYWPAHYLIDKDGVIRYTHFGEGKYDVTEKMIQTLLQEAGQQVETGVTKVEAEAPGSGKQTKETYLGADRMERFYSLEEPVIGTRTFTYTGTSFPQHSWGYQGEWTMLGERSLASKEGKLGLQFQGNKVFLVMSSSPKGGRAEIRLNGELLSSSLAGKDVQDGIVTVTGERLYELVQGNTAPTGFLEIRFLDPGISVYAFTFS